MVSWFQTVTLLASIAASVVHADTSIFVDGGGALASGWENWSWSTNLTWAATDIDEGKSSLLVSSGSYAALSVKSDVGYLTTWAGLKFDIAGSQPDVTVSFSSTADSDSSSSVPLSALSTSVSANNFTTVLINFSALPPGGTPLGNDTWDHITWQAGPSGATYNIDNIILVSSIYVPPVFLGAEPLGSNIIAVTSVGAVDFTTVHVQLNSASVTIVNKTTYVPVDTPASTITYLTLASSLAPGPLVITTGNTTWNYTLPAILYGSIATFLPTPISPLIYGINFPISASYIADLGVTMSRWGGNAVSAFNPFGGFTNAGADWYFENRNSDSADDWIGWVSGAGSETFLTVPALDWVAKDDSSFSYPATVYPVQSAFDPYNSDAGSGVYANGSYVEPVPPQSLVYTPWNMSLAAKWLAGLQNKPTVITVDNEIEIASGTHQDMHPNPMGYDEELARVLNVSMMAKNTLPNVLVAAPSSCSWWFYWTSDIGYSDNAAHNNTDFLPWFLSQMNTHSMAAGKRLLDYLDIHYYYQASPSGTDPASDALRLRMTRSLWDPTYVDESWIGTSTPQNHQPNPTIVQLIPRMKKLIAQYYPGTKLSVSEWQSGLDSDITGGLVVADSLGIFGKYGLDAATYWAEPVEQSAAALGFWLYRGYGTYFGSSSIPVYLAYDTANTLGVYASSTSGKNISLVIVNKDVKPVGLNIANVPNGKYFMRHFGGTSGVFKWQTTVTLKSTYIVVPSHTAVFLQQQ